MCLTSDNPEIDFRHVTAIEDGESRLMLYDYVIIEQGDKKWIGQITSPNINISTMGKPYDPAILHAIRVSQISADVQMAETIESWDITLHGEYEDGQLRTLRRRPKPGAAVTRLDRDLTINVLKLTPLEQTEGLPANAIGYLLNAEDVPLCVNRKLFTHHIMISGGTGSGKSNTGANLISQAARIGYTVFLYDAKPDYRTISDANSDPHVSDVWRQVDKYGLKPAGATNLTRVAIFGVGSAGATRNYEKYDEVIGFAASDFPPYLFAGLFFDEKTNVNQYEDFASVCFDLGKEREKTSFSIQDILAEVEQRKKAYLECYRKGQLDPTVKTIHDKTADAIKRKVERTVQGMPWLDSVGREFSTSSGSGNPYEPARRKVQSFSSAKFAQEGCIVHIDCANLDARSYALFLARFIELNQRFLTQKRGTKGVVEFVDEAHRLFDNASRYSDMLATQFNRVMVEGRSLKHSVIISLQNASQVPANVLNNVNTHIVMKQNNREVARTATQVMEKEFTDLSLTLSTGQALCKMFESKAVVLAQMAPSPYELERSDNAEIPDA